MRIDVRLPQAGALLLRSEGLGTFDQLPGAEDWLRLVQRGYIVPVAKHYAIFGDVSPLVVRLTDEELTAAEERSWVGQVAARLRVVDGRLTLWGYPYQDRDVDDDRRRRAGGFPSLFDGNRVTVDVPPGMHQATIHATAFGVYGAAVGSKSKKLAAPAERKPGEHVDFIIHLARQDWTRTPRLDREGYFGPRAFTPRAVARPEALKAKAPLEPKER